LPRREDHGQTSLGGTLPCNSASSGGNRLCGGYRPRTHAREQRSPRKLINKGARVGSGEGVTAVTKGKKTAGTVTPFLGNEQGRVVIGKKHQEGNFSRGGTWGPESLRAGEGKSSIIHLGRRRKENPWRKKGLATAKMKTQTYKAGG